MLEPKKHHYIPQFLLRRFSADGKTILQAKKSLNPRFISVAVRDAAAQNHYHTIPFPGALETQGEIEKKLSEEETHQAEAVREVLSGTKIEGALKRRVMDFAAFMMVRPPKVQEAMKAMIDTMHQAALRDKNSKEYTLMKDDMGVIPEEFNAPMWEIQRVLYKLVATEFFGGFGDWDIQVLQSAEGNFILADCPLTIYYPAVEIGNSGITKPQTHVLNLPLSAEYALEIYKDTPPRENCRLNVEEVAEINRRSVIMAGRFLYAPQETESLLKMIHENANHFAGITNDNGMPGLEAILPPEYYGKGKKYAHITF